MEIAASGAPNGVPTPDVAAVVDSGVVVQYLTDVLQVTLGALKSELESAGSLLSSARYNDTVQRCTRFASESQVALYVQKDIVAAEDTNGETEDAGEFTASILDPFCSVHTDSAQQSRQSNTSTPCPPKSPPHLLPFRPSLSSSALPLLTPHSPSPPKSK